MKKRLGSGKMSTTPKSPAKKTNKQTKLKSKTKSSLPSTETIRGLGTSYRRNDFWYRFLDKCLIVVIG